MQLNEGLGSFLQPTIPELCFPRVNCAVFWTKQIHKYKAILNNFSKGLLALKKYKKHSLEYNGYDIYLRKAKSRTLSMSTENTQI